MKNLLIALVLAVLVWGCSSDGNFRKGVFTSTACGGEEFSGFTMTAIHYGDSRIIVLPISAIEPNSEFRFLLVPKKRRDTDIHNFEKMDVSISSDDDDGDAEPNWLQVNGNHDDDGPMLTLCVPATLSKTQYKYDVVVENVGQLDPRADVIID